MTYKLVKDNGHGSSQEVLYRTDDLMDLAEFCEMKCGGTGMDLGLGLDGDDGGDLL